MTWLTYRAVRASLLEFSAASGLREAHHLVRLSSGRWTRTLGPPGRDFLQGRGRCWYARTEGQDRP